MSNPAERARRRGLVDVLGGAEVGQEALDADVGQGVLEELTEDLEGDRGDVGARELYGDSPAPGELFGMYEESADHGLTVKAGEPPALLKIVVEPVRF